jgi:hypothetical protein
VTARDPEALFSEISRFIDESNAALKEGAFVQMAGFDDQVRTLCEQVLLLSEQQRVEYADKLQQLLAALQTLGETMVAMRDEIGSELNALSSHKKANVAYSKVENSDKKKQEE